MPLKSPRSAKKAWSISKSQITRKILWLWKIWGLQYFKSISSISSQILTKTVLKRQIALSNHPISDSVTFKAGIAQYRLGKVDLCLAHECYFKMALFIIR
jgi:hypothetical protein